MDDAIAEARAATTAARELVARAIARHPDDVQLQFQLASLDDQLGDALAATDRAGARAAWSEALARVEPIARAHPELTEPRALADAVRPKLGR